MYVVSPRSPPEVCSERWVVWSRLPTYLKRRILFPEMVPGPEGFHRMVFSNFYVDLDQGIALRTLGGAARTNSQFPNALIAISTALLADCSGFIVRSVDLRSFFYRKLSDIFWGKR